MTFMMQQGSLRSELERAPICFAHLILIFLLIAIKMSPLHLWTSCMLTSNQVLEAKLLISWKVFTLQDSKKNYLASDRLCSLPPLSKVSMTKLFEHWYPFSWRTRVVAKSFFFLNIVYVGVFPAWEEVKASGTRVTDDCEPLCGFWESNPGLLEEQPVLLTSGPTLQPFIYLRIFKVKKKKSIYNKLSMKIQIPLIFPFGLMVTYIIIV